MRLGLGSYSYRWVLGTPTFDPGERTSTLEDLLDDAARLGVEVVQVADSVELERARPARLDSLRARARDAGVSWQTGFTGATANRLDRHVDIALALEADIIRVVLGDGSPGSPEVRAIRDRTSRLSAAGLVLGIENHFNVSSARLVELVESIGSPSVGVTLDVANSIMRGEWPAATVELLAPHAVCLHLKDYRIEADADGVGGHVVGVPLGSGLTDPGVVLRPMLERDPELAVIVEQWAPRRDTVEATVDAERDWREASVETARRWLRDLGGG